MTSEVTHLFLHPNKLATSSAHFHAGSTLTLTLLWLTLSSELLHPAINTYSAPLRKTSLCISYFLDFQLILKAHRQKYLKYGTTVKHRDSGVTKFWQRSHIYSSGLGSNVYSCVIQLIFEQDYINISVHDLYGELTLSAGGQHTTR